MKKGILRFILPLVIVLVSCSLPGNLGTPLTPTSTQTLTPTATTYSKYPYFDVPVQAVILSDDDGSHATQISFEQIKAWVDRANVVWASAGIRYLFDPQDISYIQNSLLNRIMGMDDANWNEEAAGGNQVAAQYPGKMVLFFRWGNGDISTGGAFGSVFMNFIAMPDFNTPVCGHQNLYVLAHEIGHYLGLSHTFRGIWDSEEKAATHLQNHGNNPLIFETDGISDTLPDPFINTGQYQCTNTASVTLNGIVFPLPRDNIMSYYDNGSIVTDLQAQRARWFLEKRIQNDMAMPVNANAPNAVESQDMDIWSISGCTATWEDMTDWTKGRWFHDDHLRVSSGKYCTITLGLSVSQAGKYRLDAYLTQEPDFGMVQVLLDGIPTGDPIDLYSAAFMPSGPITLGTFDLAQKTHSLTFQMVGKNDLSQDLGFGLDCFSLVPVP